MQLKGIIIALGAPNSDQGALSEMALNRLNAVLKFYNANTGYKIVCTGGFGVHFNTTPLPHAQYAADYLSTNGIPANDILEFVLSSNTIEDAVKAKPVIKKYRPRNLIVITSDFHLERAMLLFNNHHKEENLIFIGAPSTVDQNTLSKLIAHEKSAIQKLLKD